MSPQTIVTLDIGLGLATQVQRLGGVDGWAFGLTIDQAMQNVQDMGFGRDTFRQGQLNRGQHRLLIVMKNQGQDIDHLAIAAGAAQHLLLQALEGGWQFHEGRPVAQGAGLALDDRQVVPPVVDDTIWQVVRSLDYPLMFAQDLPFGGNDQTLGIDPQAHGTIGTPARCSDCARS